MAKFSLRALLGFVALAAVVSLGLALLFRKPPPLRDQVLAALEADHCVCPKHPSQLAILDGCPSVETIGLMAKWSEESLQNKLPNGSLWMVTVRSDDFTAEAEMAMDAVFSHKWSFQDGKTLAYSQAELGLAGTKVK